MKNINSTNKGRDLQLANKPRIVLWGRERMPQRIQRHGRVTLYRSAHRKREEDQTQRSSYSLDWQQSRIINCLKMYKISNEVINFIEKTWRVELSAGGRSLAETKIQRRIFQGDALSPLLFITAVMPLNHILRECTAGYKLCRSQEKINHLIYMDDLKLFAKKWKRTGNSNICS